MLAGSSGTSSDLPLIRILIRLKTALAAVLLVATAQAAQLPPEIELDRLMVKLETAIAGEEVLEAHVTTLAIEELHDERGIELPHEYFFLKAGLYLNVRAYLAAIQAITEYLVLVGREGERYREALAVLNRAEREFAIANANAERERAEKERIEKALSGMEFVRIPAGEFRRHVRGEVQRVRITKAFDLGKYEVTQEQWQAVMGTKPSEFSGCGRCPVENISWNEVVEFIRTIQMATDIWSYRLPTQAEWELASRAGTQGRYPGGFDWNFVWAAHEQDRVPPLFDAIAWHEGNSGGRTHPVGEKTPNAWGLHDMHGNVSEWMQDWSGWEDPPRALLTDPEGPAGGDRKLIEGCDWDDYFLGCEFSGGIPTAGSPALGWNRVGFRLARTVSKEHQ